MPAHPLGSVRLVLQKVSSHFKIRRWFLAPTTEAILDGAASLHTTGRSSPSTLIRRHEPEGGLREPALPSWSGRGQQTILGLLAASTAPN